MKKIFPCVLLCAAVMLASCSKDNDPEEEPIVPVSGVTIDQNTLSLVAGTTGTLVATVAPEDVTDKTVTWATADAAIATVSDAGVVTAVKVGTTTVTVTSKADATKKATCTVTVTKTVVNVSGVTLDKSTASIEIGKSESLVVTVAPVDATDKSVTWATSDAAIATVSDAGVVTALKAGTATITVASNADATKKATCIVTVTASGEIGFGPNLVKNAGFEEWSDGKPVSWSVFDGTCQAYTSNPMTGQYSANLSQNAKTGQYVNGLTENKQYRVTCDYKIIRPGDKAGQSFRPWLRWQRYVSSTDKAWLDPINDEEKQKMMGDYVPDGSGEWMN